MAVQPRTVWLEAVWSSHLQPLEHRLGPLERLTAAVYADHAREQDFAWVTLDRLMQRSGMSRDAANRARRGLVDKGWLRQISEPNRRKAAVFRLVIPDASSPPDVPLSSTRDGPLSSPSPDASSPPDVPEQSARRTQPQYLSQNSSQDGPMHDDLYATQIVRVSEALHLNDPTTAVITIDSWVKHRDQIGRPVRNPAALIDALSYDDIRRELRPHVPKPSTAKCPDCDDGAWIYDDPTDPSKARKCTHPNRPGGSLRDRSSAFSGARS